MQAMASAPGKTILFGEHSVVYGEPAIAGAVNKRAVVKIRPSKDGTSILKSYDLKFEAEIDTKKKKYTLKKGKPGIIRYILEALNRFHDHSPIEIILSSNIPIGSGLGSSAAVTVATLAALYRYHNIRFNKKSLESDNMGVLSDFLFLSAFFLHNNVCFLRLNICLFYLYYSI